MIVSTAIALQVNDKKQNKTQNRNKTNPTISKFTWTVNFSQDSFKGNHSNNKQSSRVSRDEVALQSQALLKDGSAILCTPPSILTASHHWNCVLCNQLACSIVILQLITWTVNSGQLCLKKNKKTTPQPQKPHNPKNLSAAPLRLSSISQELNFKNKTERLKIHLPIPLRTTFWGKPGDVSSGMPTCQQCPFHHSSPFLLHQLASTLRRGPAIRNNRQ